MNKGGSKLLLVMSLNEAPNIVTFLQSSLSRFRLLRQRSTAPSLSLSLVPLDCLLLPARLHRQSSLLHSLIIHGFSGLLHHHFRCIKKTRNEWISQWLVCRGLSRGSRRWPRYQRTSRERFAMDDDDGRIIISITSADCTSKQRSLHHVIERREREDRRREHRWSSGEGGYLCIQVWMTRKNYNRKQMQKMRWNAHVIYSIVSSRDKLFAFGLNEDFAELAIRFGQGSKWKAVDETVTSRQARQNPCRKRKEGSRWLTVKFVLFGFICFAALAQRHPRTGLEWTPRVPELFWRWIRAG